MKYYRVAASCFEPDLKLSLDDRRKNLSLHLETLLQEQKPDLVVVPELAILYDFDELPNCGAEPIDGPTVSAVSEIAAKHHANICIPIIEEENGKKHNAAVFIDREGRLAGKYYKHTPTKVELGLNILPGIAEPEPVVLDGLKVGTAICFDENYPDLIWNYINKSVDLLVFPSYTYAGKLMSAWAINCGVPLVCAFPWEAVIYDRDGSILAEAGTWTTTVRFGNHPKWIAHSLNMQSRIYHLDYNQPKIPEIGRKYGEKVDIRLMVREARMQITVVSDDISIEQVESEMELVPLQVYISETRAIADRLRVE